MKRQRKSQNRPRDAHLVETQKRRAGKARSLSPKQLVNADENSGRRSKRKRKETEKRQLKKSLT